MPLGTGEHAVGLGKKKYLAEELGEGTVALMKTIKAALDPHNLLNPGKVGSSLSVMWIFIDKFFSYIRIDIERGVLVIGLILFNVCCTILVSFKRKCL